MYRTLTRVVPLRNLNPTVNKNAWLTEFNNKVLDAALVYLQDGDDILD